MLKQWALQSVKAFHYRLLENWQKHAFDQNRESAWQTVK